MNYRERQIRLILQQHQSKWHEEKNILQQDIINLQNSTDIKLLENEQKETKRLQGLLDDTVNLLGNEDIKNLTDLSNLLQGKTLKELATEKDLLTNKIKDQDLALIQLAKQKIKGKKEAEKLLSDLETKWSKKEIEWEKEKENRSKEHQKEKDFWSSELAKSREIIANLEKDGKSLTEQIKNLSSNNDKLSKEKDNLVLDKNTLNEKINNLQSVNQQLNNNLQTKTEIISQNQEKIRGLEESLKVLENQLSGLKQEKNQNLETIKKLQTNLTNAWNDNKEIKQELEQERKDKDSLKLENERLKREIDFPSLSKSKTRKH